MGAPASNGKLCTKLSDMSIGDYIQCEYIALTSLEAGTFQSLGGESALDEISIAVTSDTPNGYFYFIKADKNLLIADRPIQRTSPKNLNTAGLFTGKLINGYMYRCLTADERIKYITNGDLNSNITKQDQNVWHFMHAHKEITQDRSTSNVKLFYGITATEFTWTDFATWNDGYYASFRPALEFIDNSKSTNIWY